VKTVHVLPSLKRSLSSQVGANFARDINDALTKQSQRMEQAAADEKTRRAMVTQAQADARKRPPSTIVQGEEEVKRQKVEVDPNADATALLAAFDFTTLPVALIAELIVANLQAFSEETFQARINGYRRSASISVAAPAPMPAAAVPVPTAVLETAAASEDVMPVKLPPTMPAADRARERASAQADEPTSSSRVKEEPVDPLQMDMDEDIEYEPERLNLEVCLPSYPRPMCISSTCPPQLEPMQDDDETLASVELPAGELVPLEFQAPAPAVLEEAERAATVKSAATRIWQSSGDLAVGPQSGGQDMWMLLLVRMITRVVDPEDGKGKAKADGTVQKVTGPDADVEMDEEMVELYERQDRLRKVLCDYIMADFSGR
jgi:symplekin